MKKIIKITGLALLAVVLLLAVLPFAFKGAILDAAKKEINKTMNAKIDFADLSVNFFRSFPHASLRFDDLYVAGVDEFEGDTLLFASTVAVTVNLRSLFGSSGYEVVGITLDGVRLQGIVAENGNANWDILPAAAAADTVAPVAEAESSGIQLRLNRLTIAHTDVAYDDRAANTSIYLKDLNLTLSGDMTADATRMQTQFSIASLNISMDKIPYLSNARVESDIHLDADWKNHRFTLADNSLRINEIRAGIDGWVATADDESIDLDLRLNAPALQFKDILSMIPAIYTNDFQGLQAEGEVSLEAFARGTMKNDLLPSFDARLTIADASFRYPDLPQSVTRIRTRIQASNGGGAADNTVLDVPYFHFEMGGHPFDLQLRVATPVSDPNMALTAVGKVDLGRIGEIYPLDGLALSGTLEADVQLAARLSDIRKERYEQVNAAGNITVSDIRVASEGAPELLLPEAHLAFSPRYVDLTAFAVQIGKNDLAGSGKLENYLPWFLTSETLKGSLSLTSGYFDLNDFMSSDTTDTAAAADTASAEIVRIPKNLHLNLAVNFRQIVFDRFEMNDVTGQWTLRDGRLDMKNASMRALGGALKVNGYYDSGNDPQLPEASLAVEIADVSFAKTFAAFTTVQKLAPIFENLEGNYSTNLRLKTPVGKGFYPELTSLQASGVLQSSHVAVSNVGVLNQLAATLKNESLKELKVKDLKLPFAIDAGRVTTQPFAVHFGAGDMNLSGTTGLDQTIDYTAKIDLSGSLANPYLNRVIVKIGGSFTRPTFAIDAQEMAAQTLDAVAGALLGSEQAAALTEQVNEQLDKQIETIRKQAKEAGDKLVEEAEKQGRKLIDEANKTANPIAKVAAVKAAEAAAKKLRDEAQKKAAQLNEEAEKQIQKLDEKR
jgi:hypothetical protein